VDQGRAVVIASAILGVCLLTHTGYTLVHDRSVAEAERLQRERIAQVEKEAATKTKAKGAWERATKSLDSELGSWVNEQGKSEKGKYVLLRWVWVKAYQHSDVAWKDSNNVTVKGIVIAAPESGDTKYYSWSRDLVWMDDDSWGAKKVTFAPAPLQRAEQDEMFTVNIKHPTY
jgi:hypothetical protein